MSAFKLQEVSLYALPGIKYAIAPRPLTDAEKIHRIKTFVCKYFKVKRKEVEKGSRATEYVYPRHIAMYAIAQKTDRFDIKKKTGVSLSEIGRKFGGKDHTTVINAIKAIRNYMDTDPEKKTEIEYILNNCLL